METARIQTPIRVGVQITAYLRNLLVADAGMDYKRAEQLAACVQNMMLESDWVEVDNGTTWEVTFRP